MLHAALKAWQLPCLVPVHLKSAWPCGRGVSDHVPTINRLLNYHVPRKYRPASPTLKYNVSASTKRQSRSNPASVQVRCTSDLQTVTPLPPESSHRSRLGISLADVRTIVVNGRSEDGTCASRPSLPRSIPTVPRMPSQPVSSINLNYFYNKTSLRQNHIDITQDSIDVWRKQIY